MSRLIASPLRLPTAAGCLGSLYGTFGTICRPLSAHMVNARRGGRSLARGCSCLRLSRFQKSHSRIHHEWNRWRRMVCARCLVFFLRCLGDVGRSVSWESTTTTSNCRRLRRVEEEKDRDAAAISASASRPSGLALGCQEPSGRRSIALPAVDGRCADAAKSFLPRRRGPGRGPVRNRVSLESRCRD